MMRIPTSDLPILLSDTVYAEVCRPVQKKKIEKEKAGSTTIRIRTLYLNKFAICSTSWAEEEEIWVK